MKTKSQIFGIRMLVVLVFALTMIVRCAVAQNFTGQRSHVEVAEQARRNLAWYWFGEEFPKWNASCKISASIGLMGSGGETRFVFNAGQVFGWKMRVQGSATAVQRDVIPHEVNHTIFATKFRRPLPRLLSEGAAVFVESKTEHEKQRKRLKLSIQQNRFIPFRELFSVKEYPRQMEDTMALYAEGFAIVEFLVNKKGGPKKFARFMGDTGKLADALTVHYGYKSPDDLESEWYAWYSHVAGYG